MFASLQVKLDVQGRILPHIAEVRGSIYSNADYVDVIGVGANIAEKLNTRGVAYR